MRINTVHDFRKAYRNGPHAWPGGYPLYFVTEDGAALSYRAARYNRRAILHAIKCGINDGWRVIACEVNWEDPALHCDETGERIESAYAEDEAEPYVG